MRSYLSLVRQAARKNKAYNRMTILCIIFAVFLVTSIFSLADMTGRMEKERILKKHGSWHIAVQNYTPDEYERMNKHKDIECASIYDTLNYDNTEEYYIKGKNASVFGAEPSITRQIQGFENGVYPQNRNDAVVSINAKEVFGINYGDTVTLNTPNGAVDFTVCGFCTNSEIFYLEDTIGIFVNTEAFEELCRINGKTPQFVDYIKLKNSFNIRGTISAFKAELKLNDEDVAENTALLGIMGMSTNSSMTGTYVVAGVLAFLILLAGVFMISGSINTSVAKRTQFFGMLRCIGASKRQVKNIVRLEALSWCRTAVPTGALVGVLLSWILCAVVRYGVGGEFSDMPVFQVSIIGILLGAAVGLLTVFIATGAPARRAAGTSPVTAATGNAVLYTYSRALKGGAVRIESRLGISHATGAKKNMVLMTGSFALSIVLFLCFNTVLACVKSALPAMRPSTPDFCVMSADRTNSVDKELISRLGDETCTEAVFGRMFYPSVPIETVGGACEIDLISYDEKQLSWAGEDMAEGKIEGVQNGNGLLIVSGEQSPLVCGDKLRIFGEEAEISGVLSSVPFDNSDGTPIVICSEETFRRLTGAEDYAVIDVRLSEEADGDDIARLRGITGEGYNISDRLQTNRDTVRTYRAFSLFVYGFLVLIAIIAVFNIINSIAMSAASKLKQYGILRAVGMECRQIKRMITAEATVYAFCGTVVGFIIGLPLQKLFYGVLVTEHFGDRWQLPVIQMLIICLFMSVSVALAVYAPNRKIEKMSMAELKQEG